MELRIISKDGTSIAEIIANNIVINETQDALDLIADCDYNGARKIILNEKNISPAFFDLKTGLAGEILQKFSNYKIQLAIVGEFTKYSSKSLHDFIYESNKLGLINFVSTTNEAIDKLSVK